MAPEQQVFTAAPDPATSASRIMARMRSRRWFDPLMVGAAGSAISAIGMSQPSLWNDEVATISAANRSLGELWAMLGSIDAVHGLYVLFMHFYLQAVGISEFTVRLPSLLAVGVAGAGVVVAGRMVAGSAVGLWSGIVFIILPRVTWMGIEARSSAVVTAAAVWVTIVFLVAVRTNQRRWWLVYTVGMVVAVGLFLYTALVLVAHGITLVWAHRRDLKIAAKLLVNWSASAVIAVVLVIPIALTVLGQSKQITQIAPSIKSAAAFVLVNQYFLGQLPQTSQILAPTMLVHTWWAVPALLLACIAALLIIWGSVFRAKTRMTDNPVLSSPALASSMSLLGLTIPWIIVPTSLLLLYSMTIDPIYNPRYLVFTVPAAALLIGNGIAALPRQWLRTVAILLMACCAAPVFASQRGPTAKKGSDWASTAAILNATAVPGDVVVYTKLPRGREASTRIIAVGYPLPTITSLRDITQDKTGAEANNLWGSSLPLPEAMAAVGDAKRIWVVMDTRFRQGGPRDVTSPVLNASGYHLVASWKGPATSVYEFQKEPAPTKP